MTQSPSSVICLQTDKTYELSSLGRVLGTRTITIVHSSCEASIECPSTLDKLYECLEREAEVMTDVGSTATLRERDAKSNVILVRFDNEEGDVDLIYVSGLSDEEFDLVWSYLSFRVTVKPSRVKRRRRRITKCKK